MSKLYIKRFAFKVIAFSLLTIGFGSSYIIAREDLRTYPIVETKPEKVNFGTIYEGEEVSKKILIKNIGASDLKILKVSFTCCCTVPQVVMPNGSVVVPKGKTLSNIGMLKPGEFAEIEFEFKSLGQRGKVKKKLTIITNDPENPVLLLPIEATVKPYFIFQPRSFHFGTQAIRSTTACSMLISSTECNSFEVLGFKNLPSYLTYNIEKVDAREFRAVRVTVRLKGNAPVGLINNKLFLELKDKRIKEWSINVYGEIQPPITFCVSGKLLTEMVNFGIIPLSDEITKSIEIKNDDPLIPYNIQRIKVQSRYQKQIEYQIETIKEGFQYVLKVIVRAKPQTRFISGKILLESNHPTLPCKIIPIRAWVKRKKEIG